MIPSNLQPATRPRTWMLMFAIAALSGANPQAESNADVPQKGPKPAETENQIERTTIELQEQAIQKLRQKGVSIWRKDENEDLETPPESFTIRKIGIASKDLAPIKHLPSLQWAAIYHCKLTDKHLEQLSGLQRMESLILHHNQLTDKDLAPLEKLPNLEGVSLSDNQIQGEGIKYLVKQKGIKNLFLYRNPIIDEHLIHIAKLEKLEKLGIGHTKISDEGLKHLSNMKSLTYISLYGTKVTDAAALEFQKKFPNCKVEHRALLTP